MVVKKTGRVKRSSTQTKRERKRLESQKKREQFEVAVEEAAATQKANRKLRKQYLADPEKLKQLKALLVKDLIRVFNHKHNPFKGTAASRHRYRQLGHYPEVMITDAFGNHAEFQRAAALRDLRGTAKAKNAIAKYATEQRIADYAKRHVLRHVGKFDKDLRTATGEKVLVVMSDLHSQFLDPFAWAVAKDVLKMTDPDVVVLNGDVVDFPAVSRHTRMPGAANLRIQDEIDFTKKEIFAEVRRICPNAMVFWHIGNHEHRLVRYLADSASEIADLRCLQFDKLFGVDDYEIAMVFNGNFMAPRQDQRDENVKKNYKIYYGCYAATHGTNCGKMASAEQMVPYGMSGTSGHTHRPQFYCQPTLACPTATWMSTGMMAGYAVGQHYVTDPSQWLMGLGVATINPAKQIANQVPVIIYEDWATFAGKVWTPTREVRRKRLKMFD